MKATEKHCLETYKAYLENNDSKYAYVNELVKPCTEKAVVVSLVCYDFETKKDCDIYFWIPRKYSYYNRSNGCNAKIPKWLAIKNIEKCLEQEKTNFLAVVNR